VEPTNVNYSTKLNTALLTIALLAATGCSYLPSLPSVYKIDIQQGNVVTQDMIDQLRPGLTKRQVQYVMGTPLIEDTFNQSRWDYVYSLQPGGETRQQESISLFFKDDLLTHFEGDFIPSKATTN